MNDERVSERVPWTKFAAERMETKADNVEVWLLSGLLTDCKEAYTFLDEFREQMRNTSAPIILDLSQVNHVTSCGAGILGACCCSATNADRKLCLAGLSERAEAVVMVVGLAHVTEIFPSQEEAVRELTK